MPANFPPSVHIIDNQYYWLGPFSEVDIVAIHQNDEAASKWPWRYSDYQSSVASGHLCVGMKGLSSRNDDPKDGQWLAHAVYSLAAGEAELLILAVVPSMQGRGLAKHLMTELEDYLCTRARDCYLEVRASNQRAITLYDALGFSEIGQRPNYYPAENGKRETALLFAKTLREDPC